MATAFFYAGADTASVFPTNCTVYMCLDFSPSAGPGGSNLHLKQGGTDLPGQPWNDPAAGGYVNVNGLYYLGAQNSGASGDITYEAHLADHTVVGTFVIHWLPAGTPCPDFRAAPAPVLTATPVYNPTPGLNDVRLDWTQTFSKDSHFWSIEYDIDKKTDAGSFGFLNFVHDTLTYLDTNVPVGHTYSYRVRGQEPVIGHNGYSNIVSLAGMVEVPAPIATTRASWGVLAV